MATMDDILGNGGGTPPLKGSKEWHEQQQDAPSVSSPVKGTQKWTEQQAAAAPAVTGSQSETVAAPPAKQADVNGGSLSYAELYKKLNPYKPPTDEELAKEKKKQKREQIFAAIGDGISALSNLFFTTQYAPNMYTGKNTMSERTKVRYDKLMKEREGKEKEYYEGLMRARIADEERDDRERKWQRQLSLDKKNDDRYNEGIQHRNEREKITDDRYDAEQEYKKGRDKEADRRWQANYDENKRQADRSYNFQVKRHNDNVAVERDKARATAARGVRGKQLGFSDGGGNQVAIYENVWKGSMQQVYDAMLADLSPQDEKEKRAFDRQMKKLDTPQKKEDYVKQNWHKSPKASAIMLSLSKLDPATMTSELNDEVVDYVPGGGDDDVIDYTPGKNK
jgi:hypothetical protein